MQTDLLIIQHHEAEGPGRIIQWAKELSLSHEIIVSGDDLPLNTSQYTALIILGGPMSAKENNPRLKDEQGLLLKFIAEKKPILGICLGAQLIAQALGCEIRSMQQSELGWHQISFNHSDLLVPQWHSDEIIANQAIKVIASSTNCTTQCFVRGNHIMGLQFHPEWTAQSIKLLNQSFTDCPLKNGCSDMIQQTLEVFLFNCLELWWQLKLHPDIDFDSLKSISKD